MAKQVEKPEWVRVAEAFEVGRTVTLMRYFGLDISEDKKNPKAWRLRYGELDDVPIGNIGCALANHVEGCRNRR